MHITSGLIFQPAREWHHCSISSRSSNSIGIASICQLGQFLSWSIILEKLPVLVDQPLWTHCQTWLLKHCTIALYQALRLPHGPHLGSSTMGCIWEANNLPHSLKLNQSCTPSDTIFQVALSLSPSDSEAWVKEKNHRHKRWQRGMEASEQGPPEC